MAERYTILMALPESVVRPTRELAIEMAKEYIARMGVNEVYVARVVSTVTAEITHKTAHHVRGG
jgi:hypothetical protein